MAFALLVPPFEGPDETEHLEYTNFVATHLELPNQYDKKRRVYGQGHQAPLYYVVAGALVHALSPRHRIDLRRTRNPDNRLNGGHRSDVPVFEPGVPTVYATPLDRRLFFGLRTLSVLLSVLTLLLVMGVADALGHDRRTTLLSGLFVATLPQFLFMSAMITNDVLANLTAALAAWCVVRAVRSLRARDHAIAGMAVGVGLLAKKTTLYLLPAAAVVYALSIVRWRLPRATVIRNAAVALAVAALVSAPFFVRNQLLYGDPLGSAMEKRTLHFLVAEKPLWSPYFFDGSFWPPFWRSFVGMFGWLALPCPRPVYWLYAATALLAAAGLVVRARRQKAIGDDVVTAATFVAACLGGIVFYNLTFNQAQGRYLYAALPFVAYLWAVGLDAVLRRLRSPRSLRLATGALVLLVICGDAASLARVARFYRPRPPQASAAAASVDGGLRTP